MLRGFSSKEVGNEVRKSKVFIQSPRKLTNRISLMTGYMRKGLCHNILVGLFFSMLLEEKASHMVMAVTFRKRYQNRRSYWKGQIKGFH